MIPGGSDRAIFRLRGRLVLRRFSVSLMGRGDESYVGARVADLQVAGDDTVRRFRGSHAIERATAYARKLNRLNQEIVRMGVERDAFRGVAS